MHRVWGMWEEGLERKEGRAWAHAQVGRVGQEGLEELGPHPAGSREPVKAAELRRSQSALHFKKIALAAWCPRFWWPLPWRKVCLSEIARSTLTKTDLYGSASDRRARLGSNQLLCAVK